MKILLNEKKRNFCFAYVSEHCASFGTTFFCHFWRGGGSQHVALYDRAKLISDDLHMSERFIRSSVDNTWISSTHDYELINKYAFILVIYLKWCRFPRGRGGGSVFMLSIETDVSYNRPVTGGGVVCTCRDIRSVNFFCFLKTPILQLGILKYLKVRQECYRIENHYF